MSLRGHLLAVDMHDYRLFGGLLRSDLVIPELQTAAAGTPSWTLHSHTAPVPPADGEHLGTDTVTGDVRVHMYRRADGFRMLFDDTGCFDISADGTRIDWTHGADVTMTDARADLLSRVIAAALYASGTVCLHGSAVVVGGQAIGFMAPKLHGKSTLALALVNAGAKLLTDDTLPVIGGSPARARPGLHATRLWPDSAARVGIGAAQPAEAGAAASHTAAPGAQTGPKQLFAALPDEHVTHEEHPLAALYLLAPTLAPRGGELVWRTRLSSMESAMVMIGHAKLAPLLSRSEAPALFRRAGELASDIPVYRLNVVRDLDRLDDVVATIQSWHALPAADAAP